MDGFFLNRSTFALFVALLIHLLFILLFWVLGTMTPELKKIQQEEQKIKISLKQLPKSDKNSRISKKKPKFQKLAPPMPKGKQLKKIVKQDKPLVKYEPKKPIKKTVLNKQKVKFKPVSKPKPKVELLPPQKPFIPLIEKKTKKIKEKDPMAWMFEDQSEKEEKQIKKQKSSTGGNISQNIKEIYGEEFGQLTQGQQQYIIDNQEIMRRITQQVLTRVAKVNLPRDLNVNRSNVIEFYLHPSGDMTDFKFLQKSGYYVLDDTTKETIEYAYSRYPRPKEKTLIRYNVYYNLAR